MQLYNDKSTFDLKQKSTAYTNKTVAYYTVKKRLRILGHWRIENKLNEICKARYTDKSQ